MIMSDRLDAELQALKGASFAAPGGLEQAVWRRIEAVRESRRLAMVMVPVRAACVVAALGVGVAGGGLAAAGAARDAHEISAFSLDAYLAPSTLLGGHR
jgi:predicted phage gp36 major capsid-like protein